MAELQRRKVLDESLEVFWIEPPDRVDERGILLGEDVNEILERNVSITPQWADDLDRLGENREPRLVLLRSLVIHHGAQRCGGAFRDHRPLLRGDACESARNDPKRERTS